MSTADSPRTSTTSIPRVQSPSSERSSISIDRPAGSSTLSQRRNRAALRDYYGLKATSHANGSNVPTETNLAEPQSELDRDDFDPQRYVNELLAHEGLESILKVETGLVSDIRGFDGERKALVYDNYSKLIAATDTIMRMRTNMDPLAPITSTLEPAVAHIAGTAGYLSQSLSERIGENEVKGDETDESRADAQGRESAKLQTVRWVLDTPRRLRILVQDGKREDAAADWAEVGRILDKWNGVKGVDQVREQAKAALGG